VEESGERAFITMASIHPTSPLAALSVPLPAGRPGWVRAVLGRQVQFWACRTNGPSIFLQGHAACDHQRSAMWKSAVAPPPACSAGPGPSTARSANRNGARKALPLDRWCLARDANALHLNVGLDTASVPSALSVLFSSPPDTLCYQKVAARGSPAQDLAWARTRTCGCSNRIGDDEQMPVG
jgi:hypothetical protein